MPLEDPFVVMREMWPLWKPTDAEADRCRMVFGQVDCVIACDAIRAYKVRDGRLQPDLAAVFDWVRASALAAAKRAAAEVVEDLQQEAVRGYEANLAEVASWDLDRRRRAIDAARQVLVLSRDPLLLDQPEKWPRWAVAVVSSCDWYLRFRPDVVRGLRGACNAAPFLPPAPRPTPPAPAGDGGNLPF
jgi:hypothetical protein